MRTHPRACRSACGRWRRSRNRAWRLPSVGAGVVTGGKGANRSPAPAAAVQAGMWPQGCATARGAPLPSPPMTSEIDAIRTAVLEGAPGDELASLPIPEGVRGALVRADEQEMFAGLESPQKDPRRSTHVEEF